MPRSLSNLLSADEQAFSLLLADGHDAHSSSLCVDNIQDPETIVGSDPNVPGCSKRRWHPQRLPVFRLNIRLELKLFAYLRADQRAILDLDRPQVLGNRIGESEKVGHLTGHDA